MKNERGYNGPVHYPVNGFGAPTGESDTSPSGGGDSSQPGPNTVGTEEVKDGSLQLRDMNNNIYASSNDIDQIL